MMKRWWRTADEKAADFAASRLPQSDDEFARDCGLGFCADSIRIAVAVRQSIAIYGMVDAAFIRASDSFPGELSELSGWDSVDVTSWWFELTRVLNDRIPIEALLRDIDWTTPFTVHQIAKNVYDWHRLHGAS